MKGVYTIATYLVFALMKTSEAGFTSEIALCADICPFSPLVAQDGSGMNKCYEACKRLIHRVKFGDVMDETDKKEKVVVPKPSKLSRIRDGLGKVLKRKPTKTPEASTTA